MYNGTIEEATKMRSRGGRQPSAAAQRRCGEASSAQHSARAGPRRARQGASVADIYVYAGSGKQQALDNLQRAVRRRKRKPELREGAVTFKTGESRHCPRRWHDMDPACYTFFARANEFA
jgi:hypothetical protein